MTGKKNIDLHVCATKMSNNNLNKIYQASTFDKIVHITNGLFNGDGGKLTLVFDAPLPPNGHIKESFRKIEQKISDFTGVVTLAYDLNIKRKKESMEIIVAGSNTRCIFTLHYNLYVPTNQQVLEVLPNDSVKKVRDILRGNIPSLEAVEPGSHFKEFTLGTAVDFGESITVQFKNLLEKRTKKSLAKRLIKNDKFLCYVSAFANHSAGHIYIGIDDSGIVQGEKITPRDQTELKKEISKAVGNMIWPDNSHTQGGEEKRWQINFEAVKNSNGEIVPSTFVIVIYVAQCPGGVFTKQPESYEINEENEEVKIDFPTWKKIIVEGLERDKDDGKETNKASYEADVDEMQTELLNDNCEWSELKKATGNSRTTHDKDKVRLLCLSKLIKYCIRKGDDKKADKMLEEYKKTSLQLESAKVEDSNTSDMKPNPQQKTDMNEKIGSLQDHNQKQEETIRALESSLEKLQKELENVNKAKERQGIEIEEKTSTFRTKNEILTVEKLEAPTKEFEAVENENKELKRSLEELTKSKNSLREENQQLKDEMGNLKEEHKKIREKIECKETRLAFGQVAWLLEVAIWKVVLPDQTMGYTGILKSMQRWLKKNSSTSDGKAAQKRWDDLKEKLNWDEEDHKYALRQLKELRREDAHPGSIDLEVVRKQLNEGEYVDDVDKETCEQIIDMVLTAKSIVQF